ncbi:hypothetical protein [Actinomadura nitritigenes]|uniref:hypothetical protein n=1 Tax=Actinomadura nitritigenes TaxID=134602 RepID=UPI003D93A9C4
MTWAAVPGRLAVAAIAVFLFNKAALHSKNSEFNQLSPAELRRLVQDFVIYFNPTASIALAGAVLASALILVSPHPPIPGQDRFRRRRRGRAQRLIAAA